MTEERFSILLGRWLQETITPDEKQELGEALDEQTHDALFQRTILTHLESGEFDYAPDLSDLYNRIESQISRKPAVIRRMGWLKYVAAAVLLAAIGTTALLLLNKKQEQQAIAYKRDVPAPAINKATLTLANGRQIVLSNIGNGSLAAAGAANANKTGEGQLSYSNTATVTEYHTLTNPKGSRPVTLTLADGSQVWLNAASSITFPTAFTGTNREVNMTGEAYFEVAKNPGLPFIVSRGETKVTVLGTHFNVKAYADEADVKVTLLEGAVRVNNGNANGILKPGQQAIVSTGVNVVSGVNVEQVMAWKNGLFYFDKADIKTIMQEVARWYDVEVVYQTETTELFHLKASRSTSAAGVFRILETMGGVHLELDGKKIIVKP